MYDILKEEEIIEKNDAAKERIIESGTKNFDRLTIYYSDNTLKKLLDKLKEYQPTTIGLDIYRNFPASQQLKPELEQENIIGICKKSNSEYQHHGLEPPREIKYFGFVDALHDHDDILRRHILTSKEDKKCKTTANFSLMLVLHYLSRKHPNVYAVYKKDQEEQEKQKEESNKSNNSCRIILGQAKFRYLKPAFKDIKKGNFLSSFLAAIFTTPGYYHNEDLRGCQIMLNYRSVDPAIPRIVDKDNNQPKFKTSVPSVQRLIEIVTINQILEDKIPQSEKEKLKGRIIIVGISNNLGEQPDYWKTPYSREQIPGVFIQTQMVSQILSAALDGRALITALLPWQDLILIFLSAFVSSLITNILMKNSAVLLIMILEVCLLSISYGLLIVGLWIPLIHLSLAVITSPVIIWIWDINFKEWQRKFNYHLIIGVKS
jgi:CHASE2 domain-containing sensor protein